MATQQPQQEQPQQPQNPRVFNPNEHLMQIKTRGSNSDYLPVQWRLVWFRSLFPHGSIETEVVHLDLERETEEESFVWNNETRRSEKVVKRAPGFVIFRATVKDGLGGVATGTKSEKAASFGDFLEKAETGAIGRALAALGYGTQFAGDEFDERHRIVDAPVERGSEPQPENTSPEPVTASRTSSPNGNGRTPSANGNARSTNNGTQRTAEENNPRAPMTEQQRTSLHKLYQHLGKEPKTMENMTYLAAKELIAHLSQEYRQMRARS